MTSAPAEMIVIGGGVVGSSIAYHLARAGVRTTLLERWTVGAAASGASAGGVRQQGRDPREMPLAIAAAARWKNLEAELEADLAYHRNGHLNVITRDADRAALAESVAAQQALGLGITLVEGDDLRQLAPALAPDVIAAAYTANDGHANPGQTARAFAEAAVRHGATLRTGVEVTALARTGDRVTGVRTTDGDLAADGVVLAAGAWSTALLAGIGIQVPVHPVGLQMILTTPRPPHLAQVVTASTPGPLSFKQLREGNYLIGGGWPGDHDLANPRGTIQPASITGSLAAARAIIPDVAATEIADSWVGIEAFTPDEIPILGPVPGIDNLTVAFGFCGHGFALSPMTGQVIAELITNGRPSIPIDAFAFDRFTGQEDVSPPRRPHAG